MRRRRGQAAPTLPEHWTGEQALAVFECLQAMREHLWTLYGPAVQQAWHDQLHTDQDRPELDPDEPF